MLSIVAKGNTLTPYVKATSYAVGNRVVQAAVGEPSTLPTVPPKPILKDASNVTLVNRPLKATAASVNALSQVRFAHTDIKIPSFDAYRRESSKDPKKPSQETVADRQVFTYMVAAGLGVVSAVVAKTAIRKTAAIMAPSKDVLALAKVEVSLDSIPEGKSVTAKWRGKPLFIRHRTEAEIAKERTVDISTLRDPEPDEKRVKQDKWLVVLGVCTHLGCVPIANAGDYGGYFCPCHGSHYDASGRIRKGPAPLNLEVPPYEFVGNTVVVG